jgi:hypothetical protein
VSASPKVPKEEFMPDDVADGTKPVLIKRSENSAIRIVRTVFNGKEYVDVRNMMRKGTDADWIPTRKGVMIPLDNAVDVATAMRAVSRVKQAVVVLTKEQYTKAVRSSKLVLPEHVLRTDVPKSVPTGHRCFRVYGQFLYGFRKGIVKICITKINRV